MYVFQREVLSKDRVHKIYQYLLIAAIIFLALYLRKSVMKYHSLDYNNFLFSWYTFIKSNGGVAALKYQFGDYNMAYLYFIAILTYLPLPPLAGLKLISIFFDLVVALFCYLIVQLKYPKNPLFPWLAAFAVLFTPTVILNSSVWAQCDSIYTAFTVGGIYFLMRRYHLWAFIFFGIAIAFKQQAIFAFPLLFILIIKQEIRIFYVLIIPAVYILISLPAALLGHDLYDLLTLYLRQSNNYPSLVYDAPTVYEWFHTDQFASLLRPAGIFFAGGLVLILSFLVLNSQKKINQSLLLHLAFFCSIFVPFFLPTMRERYFYLADILSIVYAFYIPRRAYIAIVVQFSSFCSYLYFLFAMRPFDERYLSVLIFVVIIITAWDLFKELRPFDFVSVHGNNEPISVEHTQNSFLPVEPQKDLHHLQANPK